ncbi:MAG: hypothetical protein ACON4V_04505 [Parvibaculales bacterium]
MAAGPPAFALIAKPGEVPHNFAMDKAAPKRAAQTDEKARQARLRMPPIIDHAAPGLWQRLRDKWSARPHVSDYAPHLDRAQLHSGAKKLARGVAYQSGLAILLLGALAVTGLALWELRKNSLPDMSLPSFTLPSFARPGVTIPDGLAVWRTQSSPVASSQSSEVVSDVPPTPSQQLADAPLTEPLSELLSETVPTETANKTTEDTPLAEEQQFAAPVQDLASTSEDTKDQALLAALQAELTAEKAAHAQTKAALAAQPTPSSQTINTNGRRTIMAEWLVRLQNGLPYDDLLARETAPLLSDILTRRERAAFSLFAETGLPIAAQLKIRIARIRDQEAQWQDTTTPLMDSDWLTWLAARSGGTIRVRAKAPLAEAPLWQALSNAVTNGDFAKAAVDMRRILRHWEAGAADLTIAPSDRQIMDDTLQALYADIQAMAELAPMWRSLRSDFIAGVRP